MHAGLSPLYPTTTFSGVMAIQPAHLATLVCAAMPAHFRTLVCEACNIAHATPELVLHDQLIHDAGLASPGSALTIALRL